MIDDPDELAEALAVAGLPDRQVGRLNVPGSDTEVIGPSTLAKPLVPLRIHARALVSRPTWRVWEQP